MAQGKKENVKAGILNLSMMKILLTQYKWGKITRLRHLFKKKIREIVNSTKTQCHDLWHLILCPFTGMRFLSPYEFAFKSAAVAFDTKAGVGIEVNNWTKAYNHVKCGNETVQCAKGVDPGSLVMLFQKDKGREQDENLKPTVKKGQQSYGGGILPQGETIESLKGFWNSTEQQVFKGDECKQSLEAFCVGTVESFAPEATERNKEQCAETTTACEQWKKNKNHGAPPQRHAAAMTGEPFKTVVTHFVQCGVPWVGGVSGSVLEQFAYAKKKGVTMDDNFVLQWMSLYTLGGFHSMGEVWAALRPMLEKFDDLKNMALEKVPSPLDLKTGCNDLAPNKEAEFLKELTKVVDAEINKQK